MFLENIFVIIFCVAGEIPKRLKGRAWKARRSVTGREGSNPSFSAMRSLYEPYGLTDMDSCLKLI